ncbi:MAG: hypothetical protein L7H00_04305 [Vulcanisaeta sp.]|nr:hypothetical protein [Vulcanisaeta sp.]MCG2892739.1 hypothetical protein [Vulcanisaeta sp.]
MSGEELSHKVVQHITQRLTEWGFSNHHVEEYGRERVVIVEFKEDFALYISVACEGEECSVDYAIGDENFTIRPEYVNDLPSVVELLRRINDEVMKLLAQK